MRILIIALLAAAALNAQVKAVIPAGAEDRFQIAGTAGKVTTAAAEGPFSRVIHVSIPEKTKNPWDMQIIGKSLEAVAAGDVIVLTLTMRAPSGTGYIVAKIQDAKGNPLIRNDIRTGAEWKQFIFAAAASNAYDKDGMQAAFFLGMQQQEIDIGNIAVLNFGNAVTPEGITPEMVKNALATLPVAIAATIASPPAGTGAATAVPQAAALLPGDPADIIPSFIGGGKTSVVAAEGKSFGNAVRVSVAVKPANHWDVQAIIKSIAAAGAGDAVNFKISYRSTSGGGKMLATLKDKSGKTVLREEITIGSEWAEKTISGKLESAADKGDLSLILTFGWQVQEVEIGGMALTAAGGGAAIPAVNTAVASMSDLTNLPPLPDTPYRRFVMMKLDDFSPVSPSTGSKVLFRAFYQKAFDYAVSNSMHIGFGISAKCLEEENAPFFAWVRSNAIENGGCVEFWNHGYDHGMGFLLDGTKMTAEFSGPPYEYQAEHFTKAMKVMKDRTGVTFRTFGTPGNAADASTLKVLEENPDIKVWLYGDMKAKTSQLVLRRSLNLEYAVGRVGVEQFMKGYRWQRTNDYFVLQGHPNMWNDASWAAYTVICEVLKNDRFEFITPMEYRTINQNN
ncbi:MAG: DUF2334 domain-containing protein [Spirochaetota bacterium]